MQVKKFAETGREVDQRKVITYALCGIKLSSNIPFVSHIKKADDKADVAFTVVREAPFPVDWQNEVPVYQSPFRNKNDEPVSLLYKVGEYDVMRFPREADFYIGKDRIIAHIWDSKFLPVLEVQLFGNVISLWLERQGVLVLHGASTVVDGRALAFLGNNGQGKSTLTAGMVQLGYSLLGDGILPVECEGDKFLARPRYPEIRLWPEMAKHFIGHNDLSQVHPEYSKQRIEVGVDSFGRFCNSVQPLGCLYIPDRRDPLTWGDRVEIEAIPPRNALLELLRYSFLLGLPEAIGLGQERFKFLSRLAMQVPVRRVTYPVGMDYVSIVCRAILGDFSRV